VNAPARAFTVLVVLLSSCAKAPPPRPLPPPPAPEPIVMGPAAPPLPRREVLELAIQAYKCGEREGRFRRPVLTVIDYSLPSSEPRLWVIDLDDMRVLQHELVAHGEKSGLGHAVAFSNQMGSHQSSLGLFRTDEAYKGRFGYSLRLSGLESGINDNARERAIVIHGMDSVSHDYVAKYGTLGRSWGCPAVPDEAASNVIDLISGGSAVFAYYPDASWLQVSRYLHCDSQVDVASGSGD
jgi:hypothetical protein